MLKNNPSNQLQEKFHVINGYQKRGENEFVLTGSKKGTKKMEKARLSSVVCTRIAKPQTCKHCVKSHLSKNLIRKRVGEKKRGRNMLLKYFYKGKNRHHTSHRFFHKTSCTSRRSRSAARSPRTRDLAASTAPSPARKTWLRKRLETISSSVPRYKQ